MKKLVMLVLALFVSTNHLVVTQAKTVPLRIQEIKAFVIKHPKLVGAVAGGTLVVVLYLLLRDTSAPKTQKSVRKPKRADQPKAEPAKASQASPEQSTPQKLPEKNKPAVNPVFQRPLPPVPTAAERPTAPTSAPAVMRVPVLPAQLSAAAELLQQRSKSRQTREHVNGRELKKDWKSLSQPDLQKEYERLDGLYKEALKPVLVAIARGENATAHAKKLHAELDAIKNEKDIVAGLLGYEQSDSESDSDHNEDWA